MIQYLQRKERFLPSNSYPIDAAYGFFFTIFHSMLNLKGMTIEQFGSTTYYVQQTMIKFHGVLLLEISSGTTTAMLYQLDSFYVEVVYSTQRNSPPRFQCRTVDEIDHFLSLVDVAVIYT